MTKLCNRLNASTSQEIDNWLHSDPFRHRGRLPIFNKHLSDEFLKVVDKNRLNTLNEIRDNFFFEVFAGECYEFINLVPSMISHELHKRNWSRKHLKRKN